MIEVKNLTKSFGDKTVLRGINARFETGKTNLIIGQSGSGKTVLMKNLVGLLHPTSGEVLYDGRDFVGMTKREQVMMRREMGMIFQGAALFDSMSVRDNVQFPLDMFSSLNYARAIVLNPKYLFCDEPNSGLDPQTSLVIDHLLSDITHEYGITTIINTHDMNSVMGIGENIIFIYKGTKEWQGVSADIMGSTNERLTDFIFASDLLKKMKRTEMQG